MGVVYKVRDTHLDPFRRHQAGKAKVSGVGDENPDGSPGVDSDCLGRRARPSG
jgi:hypothetical protein